MRYFENVILFSRKFLHLFYNDKWGGLWMVRFSLYQGGRRLILASNNFCVCGQEFMLNCFTGMMCISMAVVGDNGRPLSG